MDISAARQLLRNTIAAARLLGRDEELQAKWSAIIAQLPDYEVAPDGSFREWLWPGLDEQPEHRHASQLYALYDEMPAEILDRPEFVRAIGHTIRLRYDFHRRSGVMAFGLVQLGLSAAHIGHSELTEDITHFLARHYWSTGMASFHNRDALFNMDISGGFPYLCASALVYADPGVVRLFPARPAAWTRGSISGLRLRGGIVVKNLSWDGDATTCELVSDQDQTIRLESRGREARTVELRAGVATTLD
jgi:alpha-L-fucosidase 2